MAKLQKFTMKRRIKNLQPLFLNPVYVAVPKADDQLEKYNQHFTIFQSNDRLFEFYVLKQCNDCICVYCILLCVQEVVTHFL